MKQGSKKPGVLRVYHELKDSEEKLSKTALINRLKSHSKTVGRALGILKELNVVEELETSGATYYGVQA